jgi:hypothetical protein
MPRTVNVFNPFPTSPVTGVVPLRAFFQIIPDFIRFYCEFIHNKGDDSFHMESVNYGCQDTTGEPLQTGIQMSEASGGIEKPNQRERMPISMDPRSLAVIGFLHFLMSLLGHHILIYMKTIHLNHESKTESKTVPHELIRLNKNGQE